MRKRPLRLLTLILALIQGSQSATSILDDYAKCKNEENFGIGGNVLCDADASLKPGTKDQLNKLLDDLQSKVTCNCENGCTRGGNLTSDFVGLLIVSDSNKTQAALRPLSESAQYIYEDALLGNETCDNGLLIVYLEDQQKLATYRGGGNFLLLNDNDVGKLHKASSKNPENDQAALRYLLTHYDTFVEGARRSDSSFIPYFGLLIALILALLIFTCLVACCCWKLCACCNKRSKRKDKYQVTPISTYKPPAVEPIYIVTPPPPHREGIYSSPFHGSPVPPPSHRPPSSFTPSPGPGASSRPITPSSTHRTKIYSVTSNPSVKSPVPTPKEHSTVVTRSQSASSKQHNQITPPEMPSSTHPPVRPSRSSPVAGESPSDVSIDLPFMDPNRPREVQTKKDYIY